VPLDLHYLLTTGSDAPASPQGLSRLADAIRAIEAASPLVVPEAFQATVWLSLLPMTTDELSRIWGLFPNENCRTSIAFRASHGFFDDILLCSTSRDSERFNNVCCQALDANECRRDIPSHSHHACVSLI